MDCKQNELGININEINKIIKLGINNNKINNI